MLQITDTYRLSKTEKGGVKPEINYMVLAQYCAEKFCLLNYQDCLFIKINGIYIRDFTSNLMKSKISHVLLDEISLEPNAKLLGEINTVLSFIKLNNVNIESPFNTEDCLINCEDGVLKLDFEQKKVVKLPDDNKFKFTYKLPVTYNESVSTTQAEEFFKKFDENTEGLKNSVLLKQIAAHVILQICFPNSTYKYSHLIHSDPNCGKTSLMNLYGKVFGDRNCSSEELENICNGRFTLSSVYGKIINKFDDLPKKPVDIGRFKAITGGGEVSIEFKGSKPFNSRINAVHIYTCNAVPHLTSADTAFWERFIYVHLTKVFERNSAFESKCYTKEFLQSCFKLFINTAFEIYENGNDLIGQETHLKMMDQSFMDNNLVHRFVQERCYKVTDSIITRKKFNEEFNEACMVKYKVSPDLIPSSQKIADYMKNNNYTIEESGDLKETIGNKRERCWYNIAWKGQDPTFVKKNDKEMKLNEA